MDEFVEKLLTEIRSLEISAIEDREWDNKEINRQTKEVDSKIDSLRKEYSLLRANSLLSFN